MNNDFINSVPDAVIHKMLSSLSSEERENIKTLSITIQHKNSDKLSLMKMGEKLATIQMDAKSLSRALSSALKDNLKHIDDPEVYEVNTISNIGFSIECIIGYILEEVRGNVIQESIYLGSIITLLDNLILGMNTIRKSFGPYADKILKERGE